MGRIDRRLFSITSGLCCFLLFSSCKLHFPPVPLRGLRSRHVVDYLSCIVHNGARRTEHSRSSMNVCLGVTVIATSLVLVTLFRNTNTTEERQVLLWWHIRPNEHLAKVFQLLRAPDFLREQRELDDMEEFVIEFVSFVQILLLHLVANVAMLAVGR